MKNIRLFSQFFARGPAKQLFFRRPLTSGVSTENDSVRADFRMERFIFAHNVHVTTATAFNEGVGTLHDMLAEIGKAKLLGTARFFRSGLRIKIVLLLMQSHTFVHV